MTPRSSAAMAPNPAEIERLLAGVKTCSTCSIEKRGPEFTVAQRLSQKPYLEAQCKRCKAAYEKSRRERDPSYRERLRTRSREAYERRQAASLELAVNLHKEWTGADLETALRPDLSVSQAASMLGRTVQSIQSQRHIHKKDPRKQVLAGLVRSDL